MSRLKQFGKMLQKAREKAGLTQADVAKTFNYSTAQFISNWERGISYPPYHILRKLCSMYQIDVEVAKKKLRLIEIENINNRIDSI